MSTGIESLYGGAEALGSMSDEQVAAILQGPPGQIPQFMAMAELGRRDRSKMMAGGGPPPAEPTVKDELLARMSQSNMAPGGLKDVAGAMQAPRPQAPPTTYAAGGMFPSSGNHPSLSEVASLNEIADNDSSWWDWLRGAPVGEEREVAPVGDILRAAGDWMESDTGVSGTPSDPDYVDDTDPGFLKWEDFEMPPPAPTAPPAPPAPPGGETPDAAGVGGPFVGAEKEKYNDWLALAAAGGKLASGNPSDFGPAISTGIEALIANRADVDKRNRDDELLGIEREKLDIARAAATAKGTPDGPDMADLYKRLEFLDAAVLDANPVTLKKIDNERKAIHSVLEELLRRRYSSGGLYPISTAPA